MQNFCRLVRPYRNLKNLNGHEDSSRKFLVSWKMSLFYYETVFWPTEINMRNCLLNFNIKKKICWQRF